MGNVNDSVVELEGTVVDLADVIEYQSDSIVSKTLVDESSTTVTAFALDEGQRISEHAAPHRTGPGSRGDRFDHDRRRRTRTTARRIHIHARERSARGRCTGTVYDAVDDDPVSRTDCSLERAVQSSIPDCTGDREISRSAATKPAALSIRIAFGLAREIYDPTET